jgi:hypothetical protein
LAILEKDLFSLARSSGVFMRGIRKPGRNLSEKMLERAVLDVSGIRMSASLFVIVFAKADPPCPESLPGVRKSM